MLDILISNVSVVTMDALNTVLTHGYVGIRDGKIAYVSCNKPDEDAKQIIDGANRALMPGLVNLHTHINMTCLRGYSDDLPLFDWLSDLTPPQNRMNERAMYLASMLGLAEMIAGGTTSISSMDMFLPTVMQAAFDAGIKGCHCNSAFCPNDTKEFSLEQDYAYTEIQRAMELHNADDGRIRLDAGIHAEYTTAPALWRSTTAFAAKYNLGLQVHLSETVREHEDCIARYHKTPACCLLDEGVFSLNNVVAAHCVHVSNEDLDLLKSHNVAVAHNPSSNLKLGSGIAPVHRMLEQGLLVGIGTDSAASNNALDMLHETRMAALLQKGVAMDPTLVPAMEALRMATVNGAQAQGRGNECGCIVPGYDADLILIRTDSPRLSPVNNIVSTLVYSATSADVCLTMVRGKILYQDGAWTTIDVPALRDEIDRVVMPLIART